MSGWVRGRWRRSRRFECAAALLGMGIGWVNGWVGGWMGKRKMDEEQAVLGMVGGLVGGDLPRLRVGGRRCRSCRSQYGRAVFCMGAWVGGWVGGWVGSMLGDSFNRQRKKETHPPPLFPSLLP